MFWTRFGALGILAIAALALLISDGRVRSVGVADRVVVYKADRLLQLFDGDEVLMEYPISLGDNPIGHKTQRGDEKTPEGRYRIDWRNPNSVFHLSLHISYPNKHDREQAALRGVSPGGAIMIHGQPNGRAGLYLINRFRDWTDGCISVSSSNMREIWDAVPDGMPIEIYP